MSERSESRPVRVRWREQIAKAESVPLARKGLALILAEFGGNDGRNVHPGMKILMLLTGLKERAILAHLAALKADGWLVQTASGHDGSHAEYWLTIPERVHSDAPTDREGASQRHERVHSSDGEGALRCTPSRQDPEEEDPDLSRASREERSQALSSSRPRTVKSAIPEDWAPNEGHRVKARSLGLFVEPEVEAFRDHALAVGREVADWDAAFRNWLTKANRESLPQRRAREAASQGAMRQPHYGGPRRDNTGRVIEGW